MAVKDSECVWMPLLLAVTVMGAAARVNGQEAEATAPAAPVVKEAPQDTSPAVETAAPAEDTAASSEETAPADKPAAKPVCCPKSTERGVCCCGHCVDWSKVPGSYRILARPGNFPLLPSGCGYYTLCDQYRGIKRPKRQPEYFFFGLMPPGFFDADFRYVDDIPVCEQNCVERLKRIPLGDCWKFSTGGNYWARYMNEYNSRLGAVNNDYTLMRTRVYGDLVHGSGLRLFTEFIWADIFEEELSPLPIDVNRGDLLNAFVEAPLLEVAGKDIYARFGRQELVLGSQRLVSSLDWANTRRTFDGVRIFRQGDKWDWDVFYTKFVPVKRNDFDTNDNQRDFGGFWLTKRPKKGHFRDLYYLYFNNDRPITRLGLTIAPTETHTIGARHVGDKDGMLWDFEGALQWGTQGAQDQFAGMATVGLGRRIKRSPVSMAAWIYYDFASGGQSSDGSTSNTFNQQYPFGHYYLGWIDLVGRQNIHDVNAHLIFYPQHWLTVWMQYHHFWLADPTDALYNVGGVAIRRDPTGAAGTNVGDELDLVLNFHLNRYSDVLLGYSHLYGGGFLRNTGASTNAGFCHCMYQMKW